MAKRKKTTAKKSAKKASRPKATKVASKKGRKPKAEKWITRTSHAASPIQWTIPFKPVAAKQDNTALYALIGTAAVIAVVLAVRDTTNAVPSQRSA